MTKEQIKQNANDYTHTSDHNWTWDDSGESRVDISVEVSEAFIAGAHSRDGEIYDLKRDIEDLQKMVKMRSDAFECARKEIDRSNNPWISVEERLPPRDVALIFPTHSIPVIGMIGNSTDIIHTGMRYDYSSKEWCYGFTPMRKYGANKDDLLISGDTLPVTHWMPIPELKKGE
jgi:hypothetical protein